MLVYVIAKDGQPLMPTERCGKVRRMLRDKKARVVKRCPFTIQLLYESTMHTQDVTLGVDAGYRHIGICASTERKTLYAAKVDERTDIVGLLKTRREQRRGRRSRKIRYRKPRFDNRAKQKGWRAPSVEHKIDTHINSIKTVMKMLPVSKIRVETAEFDIHKIKNPDVEGVEYQYGEKYGHYNTRNYVLWRDSHRCRCCGKEHTYLYVVSADGTVTEAPEDLYTVCRDCLEKHLTGEKRLDFKRKRHFAPPTQMGIMRDALLDRLRESVDIPVEQTYGYVTKGLRNDYRIEKSHVNDAFCIAGNMGADLPEWDGDYTASKSFLTLEESNDRIIVYVHFNHDGHAFNKIFAGIGNIEYRDEFDLYDYLDSEEVEEIVDYARELIKKDFAKEEKYAKWAYGDFAEELGAVDVEEDTKRTW